MNESLFGYPIEKNKQQGVGVINLTSDYTISINDNRKLMVSASYGGYKIILPKANVGGESCQISNIGEYSFDIVDETGEMICISLPPSKSTNIFFVGSSNKWIADYNGAREVYLDCEIGFGGNLPADYGVTPNTMSNTFYYDIYDSCQLDTDKILVIYSLIHRYNNDSREFEYGLYGQVITFGATSATDFSPLQLLVGNIKRKVFEYQSSNSSKHVIKYATNKAIAAYSDEVNNYAFLIQANGNILSTTRPTAANGKLICDIGGSRFISYDGVHSFAVMAIINNDIKLYESYNFMTFPNDNYNTGASIAKLDTDKAVVVVVKDSDNTDYCTARVLTVSGTVISLGAANTIITTANTSIGVINTGVNSCAVIYQASGTRCNFRFGYATGTTIAFGNETAAGTDAGMPYLAKFVQTGDTSSNIGITSMLRLAPNGNNIVYAINATVPSNTTTTSGTASFTSGTSDTSKEPSVVVKLNDSGKFAVLYNVTTRNAIMCNVGTRTAATTTLNDSVAVIRQPDSHISEYQNDYSNGLVTVYTNTMLAQADAEKIRLFVHLEPTLGQPSLNSVLVADLGTNGYLTGFRRISNDKFVVSYYSGSAAENGNAVRVISVSGSTITVGAALSLNSPTTASTLYTTWCNNVYKISDTKIAVNTTLSSPAQNRVDIVNISGTTCTLGTSNLVNSSDYYAQGFCKVVNGIPFLAIPINNGGTFGYRINGDALVSFGGIGAIGTSVTNWFDLNNTDIIGVGFGTAIVYRMGYFGTSYRISQIYSAGSAGKTFTENGALDSINSPTLTNQTSIKIPNKNLYVYSGSAGAYPQINIGVARYNSSSLEQIYAFNTNRAGYTNFIHARTVQPANNDTQYPIFTTSNSPTLNNAKIKVKWVK